MSNDLDFSWLEEAKKKGISESLNKKEQCPYCSKEFKSLSRHINKCPKNPENKNLEEIDQSIKELQEEIEDKDKIISALASRLSLFQEFALTEENVIKYFQRRKYSKKYELYYCFIPHDTRLIEKIVDNLLKKGILKRTRGTWFRINPKFKKESEKKEAS